MHPPIEKASGMIQGWLLSLGSYGYLVKDTARQFFKKGVSFQELSQQIVAIGVNSLPIVLLTAIFTGMVLALQTAYGLERFGAKNYVGSISGLAFVRELGPVLTGIVLCGRVGAGVAAEIASMVVTEQVDAMRALGANPIQRLVVPRLLAAMLVTPLLVILADAVGIYGGLLVAVYELNLTSHLYFKSLIYTLYIRDIIDGLLKSFVFGFIVVSIACYKGLRAHGGTEGVGRTTTSAVVTGSMYLFIADFFLTKLLLLL
jgi:phospholipid/cholesterol/gamma-HCH transport system permease protein